jgi:plasmid stabilization system protein ParE
LAGFPQIGSSYPNPKVNQVRRFYLERLTSHLYYTFDEEQLIIRALWHARRGTGPDLGSV